MLMSVCGMDCSKCNFFPEDCAGCPEMQGKPFWTNGLPEKVCGIYTCVSNKNLENCGGCAELPCKKFFTIKDPDVSETDHRKNIQERIERLKNPGPLPPL